MENFYSNSFRKWSNYSIVRTAKTQARPSSILMFRSGSKRVLLVSILNWMLLEALSNAFHETFPNTVHVQVCSSQEITSWPNYMLSMCHIHFRRVYLFLLGYMMPRMFSMESHSPWFSTFVCWAWTTTHKVHHKQEVNKIVKEHASFIV